MAPSDYAFIHMYGYDVNQNIYEKHRSHEYNNSKSVKSLQKLLRRMDIFNDPPPEVVWPLVVKNNLRPVIRIEVRNYEEPYNIAKVDFLVDTGSDISMLTADTADNLGIDRNLGSDDAIIIKGISGKRVMGLSRWIYTFLGGKLHPTPVLVPPIDNHGSKVSGIPLVQNILGRAAITNCFLMCFDSKRLYAFPRWASGSSKL